MRPFATLSLTDQALPVEPSCQTPVPTLSLSHGIQGKGAGCGLCLAAWRSNSSNLMTWVPGHLELLWAAGWQLIHSLQGGVEVALLVQMAQEPSTSGTLSYLTYSELCSPWPPVSRQREPEAEAEDAMGTPALKGSPRLAASVLAGSCSPGTADLCLSRLERGRGIGPGMPRDRRIL